MLVLTRKTEEKILIGDNVVITVNKIQGNRVWIGLDAPASVRIVREEIAAKPQKDRNQVLTTNSLEGQEIYGDNIVEGQQLGYGTKRAWQIAQ